MTTTEKPAPDYRHPAAELFDEIAKIDADLAAIGAGTRDGFTLVYKEDALDAVDRAEQQVDAWLDAMVAEARALACNGEINQVAFAGVGDLFAAGAFFKRVREALERPSAPGYPDLVSSRSRSGDRDLRSELDRKRALLAGRIRSVEITEQKKLLDAETKAIKEAEKDVA